jgi:predicted peroxiredoxin
MSKTGNEQLLHQGQTKKKAIILLSGENEHTKAFHALLYALDLNEHGFEVKIYFDGEGTVWLRKLQEPNEKLGQYLIRLWKKD